MKMNLKLKQDINIYNELKSCAISAFKKREYEKCLKIINIACYYAWQVHFGIWYDINLEKIMAEIGINCKLKSFQTSKNISKENIRKIAYITSDLKDFGGHASVLKNWIKILSEKSYNQDLYITSIKNGSLFYPNLKKFLNSKGVKIYELSHNITYLKRINKLIYLLEQNSPDIIFLFIHPFDVIVIPALTALSNKPLTYFINHADHTFWLGKKILDRLIEFRAEGAKYSRKFRKINVKQYIIPLTTEIKPQKISKTKFGVPENSTLSISIGNFWKVIGKSDYDYFKTIEKLLKEFPNHYHMFVTVPPPEDMLKKVISPDSDIYKRFIINGPISNLESIYGVGDFLISTFPMVGGMVQVEAMACGLPIVAFRNKKWPLLSELGGLPPNYQFIASTDSEIVNYSSQLIKNPKLREEIGKQLYDYYSQKLSPKVIRSLLINIIEDNPKNSALINIADNNSTEIKYNVEYAHSRNYETQKIKKLCLNSLFSTKQRIKFFIEAFKRKKFNSMREAFVFAFLAVIGRYIDYLPKLKKILL